MNQGKSKDEGISGITGIARAVRLSTPTHTRKRLLVEEVDYEFTNVDGTSGIKLKSRTGSETFIPCRGKKIGEVGPDDIFVICPEAVDPTTINCKGVNFLCRPKRKRVLPQSFYHVPGGIGKLGLKMIVTLPCSLDGDASDRPVPLTVDLKEDGVTLLCDRNCPFFER
jgi:hypothetical protein